MASILVTGCAGFIGSHLCEVLLAQGHRVAGLDNFDPFYDRAMKERNMAAFQHHPRFSFHELELQLGAEALADALPAEPVDVVVHLAAKAGVGPSVRQPVAYLQANVLGTAQLLEWMRARGIQKLFFASSSSVYGNTRELPFREDMPLLQACISPYAASKLACEQLLYTYHHLHGLAVLNARFFTVYGPRQRPDLAIYKFVQLLRAGQPIPVFGDGTTARDYTFVLDTVAGISQGVEYLLTHEHVYETINLGNHRPIPLLELIATIGAAVGREPKLVFEPMQAGDVDVTYADIRKAQHLLGYAPATELRAGIEQFVQWLDAAALPPAVIRPTLAG